MFSSYLSYELVVLIATINGRNFQALFSSTSGLAGLFEKEVDLHGGFTDADPLYKRPFLS